MKNKPVKKNKHGGRRKGSGRKKKAPTKIVGVRHSKEIVTAIQGGYTSKEIQESGRRWLNGLYDAMLIEKFNKD